VLVLDAGDLGILECLGVEADGFDRGGSDRCEALEAFGPGFDVADPAGQRGRQPALRPAPVEEAGLAIAGLAGAAEAAQAAALGQGGGDGGAAMLDVEGEYDLVAALARADQRHPGGPGAGVDTDLVGLGGAGGAVLQDDGEGVAAENRRPALLEQLPGPCRVAGVERLSGGT
jgi:hypothetical protein